MTIAIVISVKIKDVGMGHLPYTKGCVGAGQRSAGERITEWKGQYVERHRLRKEHH